jgi:hypothetical protein
LTRQVNRALIQFSSRVTSPSAIRWVCTAISHATTDANRRAGLSTSLHVNEAVVAAMVAMARRATTPDAVQWLCTAICNLTAKCSASTSVCAFATISMRDALIECSAAATTSHAVQRLAAIHNIALIEQTDKLPIFCNGCSSRCVCTTGNACYDTERGSVVVQSNICRQHIE